jgi:hypothetical protein
MTNDQSTADKNPPVFTADEVVKVSVFDVRIAGNIVELLKKVKGIDGMEALAYAEAFAYVSQFVAAKPVGVPFTPGAKSA